MVADFALRCSSGASSKVVVRHEATYIDRRAALVMTTNDALRRPYAAHIGLLYNTNFSRGGNFRYIREFGFCAKFSSRENNIHCEWNFAKFSSREIFLPAKIQL